MRNTPERYPGPALPWAVVLLAGISIDAASGRWAALPALIVGVYGGALAGSLSALPLPERRRSRCAIVVGGLWLVASAALAPFWLGRHWGYSTPLQVAGALAILLPVGAGTRATRDVTRKGLLHARLWPGNETRRDPSLNRPDGEDYHYIADPLRDAGLEVVAGAALLTSNQAVALLAGAYLLRRGLGLLLEKRKARRRGAPATVSVVIPTLNEEKNIGALLLDIRGQSRPPEEVIVVDGGSTDGTAGVVEGFSGVRLLVGDASVAGQRNLGGERARGEVIVFLDADVRLEETFLEGFLERFEGRDLGLACPFYMPSGRAGLPTKAVHVVCNGLFVSLKNILPSGSGQCIAVRRCIFRKSGGFDTGLSVAEDMELIRRLARRYRFGIIPRSVFVSDRRFEEYGVLRMVAILAAVSLVSTVGWFRWANYIKYEFGNHGR